MRESWKGNSMQKISRIFLCALFVVRSTTGFSHGEEVHEDKKKLEPKQHEDLEVKKETKDLPSESLALINKSYQGVLPIFRKACFDCHSSETKFPWYSKLPFVSNLIEHDVKEAKKHLIMGETFPFAGHGKPLGDLEAIEESIKGSEMPPFRYQIMHWGAFLSKEEKAKIFEWVTGAKNELIKQ